MEQLHAEMARYEQIALLLARDIVKGIYKEGDRISGRSTLAGKFNISPETVRKALALLAAKEVVDVVPGSGTVILSRQAAHDFVDSFMEYGTLEVMERRLQDLTKQRNKLNAEIERVVKDIVAFKTNMLKNMQNAEEIVVATGSPLIGFSLQETRLRTITGVTVTAVRHKGRWYVSPGAEFVVSAGDVMLAMGAAKGIDQLRELASGQK